MTDLFNNFFYGRRILVTGHTGFKGSWFSIWLHELSAEAIGVVLDPLSERDDYVLPGIGSKIKANLRVDIRDGKRMKTIFREYQPEITSHPAVQPLARLSYEIPIDTYATNVMGIINVMEATRTADSVKVSVMITTNKCYESKEQMRGCYENESMGGYDSYSSSKGAAEIVIASWRRSSFNPVDHDMRHHVALVSVRVGNATGGGDWVLDRIVSDYIKALEAGKDIGIRSPKAIRPWQHALEPLSGYMPLTTEMWEEPTKHREDWSFGPRAESIIPAWDTTTDVVKIYGSGKLSDMSNPNVLHEARLLMPDISKAKFQLGWEPGMNIYRCTELTVDWYKRYKTEDAYDICLDEINQFISE